MSGLNPILRELAGQTLPADAFALGGGGGGTLADRLEGVRRRARTLTWVAVAMVAALLVTFVVLVSLERGGGGFFGCFETGCGISAGALLWWMYRLQQESLRSELLLALLGDLESSDRDAYLRLARGLAERWCGAGRDLKPPK
ncbi:MAG: hypothetical protein AAF682_20945 [Planctomycetota bacterium]